MLKRHRTRKKEFVIAALLSATAHGGFLLAFNQTSPPPTTTAEAPPPPVLLTAMFEEPPVPVKPTEDAPPVEETDAAPTHAVASLPEPAVSYTVGDLTQSFTPSLPVAPAPDLGQSFSIPVGRTASAPPPDKIMSFDVSELDRVPRRIRTVAPVYPMELKRARVEGDVELVVIIDPTGAVKVEKALGASPRDLVTAAIRAAEQCTFEPPRRNGELVHARYSMRVPFRIQVAAR